MYPMTMHRINRSPDGGEGGGLPASATPAADPAAAAPSYLDKSEFESFKNDFSTFRNEITGTLKNLTPAQREAREDAKDAKNGKAEGVKRPSPKDFDFEKDPTALERYEDAMDEYRYQTRKAKEVEQGKAAAAAERVEKSLKGHKARTLEYKKANPSYDADLKAHGPMSVENDVAESVYESEESAAIVHYFAKNKGVSDELNQLALMGNNRAIDRRIGEIAAEIRAERKALEANAEAAGAKIPRQTFKKGSEGAKREPTMEERYERNRS